MEGARKEGVGKISGIGRAAGAHGDEAGQVLVFRAQPVKYPAANGRPYLLHLAGVLHVSSRTVRRCVGVGGTHDSHIIGVPADVRPDLGHLQTALTKFWEIERGG